MVANVVVVNVAELNERQKRFCEYYCGAAHGSAQKAALMAGYSDNYARAKSFILLRKPEIQVYIQELNQPKIDANIASITDIQTFWTEVMQDNTARPAERLKASELLAKCKGAFKNDW